MEAAIGRLNKKAFVPVLMNGMTKGQLEFLTDLRRGKRVPEFITDSLRSIEALHELHGSGGGLYWSGKYDPEATDGNHLADAKNYALESGVFVLNNKGNAIDLLEALKFYGWEITHHWLEDKIQVRHKVLTGGQWRLLYKDATILGTISRYLHEVCCCVAKSKRPAGKKLDDGFKDTYLLLPIPERLWTNRDQTIIKELQTLVVEGGNGHIKTVNPLADFAKEVRNHIQRNGNRIEDMRDIASNFLNVAPHLQPVNSEIGHYSSINISRGLGTRLIEAEKYQKKYEPTMQREMVVLASPKHSKIGKTRTVTALLPLELQEDYVVQNLSLKDMTKAERACKAKLLVIGDELTGIAHSQRDLVNSFITSTMSFVGEKFERERNIPRTAWLIATSNQMYLPDDEANSTKNRILLVKSNREPSQIISTPTSKARKSSSGTKRTGWIFWQAG